jgi:hypothetical protein
MSGVGVVLEEEDGSGFWGLVRLKTSRIKEL